jgi:hypothetical protein
MNDSKEQRKKHIEALEAEKAGYLAVGKKDRAKAVDDELANWGAGKPKATTSDSTPKVTREGN